MTNCEKRKVWLWYCVICEKTEDRAFERKRSILRELITKIKSTRKHAHGRRLQTMMAACRRLTRRRPGCGEVMEDGRQRGFDGRRRRRRRRRSVCEEDDEEEEESFDSDDDVDGEDARPSCLPHWSRRHRFF